MKCPHCLIEIHPGFEDQYLLEDVDGHWAIYHMKCPNNDCNKLIIKIALVSVEIDSNNYVYNFWSKDDGIMIYPKTRSFTPASKEVDPVVANDFNEASVILDLSPKASAALSRRCLQYILREKAKVKHTDLSKEIQEVIDSKQLPQSLSQNLDAIRTIGNFAAHPTKNTSTGEIIDVEPVEAEWLLNTLEFLIQFYYIQPAENEKKFEKLNKKLEEAGKPRLK